MKYNMLGAIVMLIVLIIPIVIIYSLTLQWIDKLEKTNCRCSEGSQRDFIKYYLYAYLVLLGLTIVIAVISVFVEFSSMKFFKAFRPFVSLIRTLMAILSIANIIVSIIYISKLKEIGEGGLLGLDLHPDFSENSYVYLYYTYENIDRGTQNRVVRMTYQDEKLSSEKIIVDKIS